MTTMPEQAAATERVLVAIEKQIKRTKGPDNFGYCLVYGPEQIEFADIYPTGEIGGLTGKWRCTVKPGFAVGLPIRFTCGTIKSARYALAKLIHEGVIAFE